MYSKITEATDRDSIYSVLNAIPRGQVSSYGKVAAYAQLPNGARLVGRILGQLPKGSTLPWHRVLKANGQIAFPRESATFQRQKQLLEAEDVIVTNGKINLKVFGWQP
jgi:methylated-DNA-protein-cysteine methyltransferase-like protein